MEGGRLVGPSGSEGAPDNGIALRATAEAPLHNFRCKLCKTLLTRRWRGDCQAWSYVGRLVAKHRKINKL